MLYHNFAKDNIKNFTGNLSNLSIQDHHLIQCHRIFNWRVFNLEKRNSSKLYKIQLSLRYENPAGQAYPEKKFELGLENNLWYTPCSHQRL